MMMRAHVTPNKASLISGGLGKASRASKSTSTMPGVVTTMSNVAKNLRSAHCQEVKKQSDKEFTSGMSLSFCIFEYREACVLLNLLDPDRDDASWTYHTVEPVNTAFAVNDIDLQRRRIALTRLAELFRLR